MSDISFIHISDIHFNKHSGDNYDIDSDLRSEIVLDIENNAKEIIPTVNGILVCGDIAFSGVENEYKAAIDFLSLLCDKIGIPETSVFTVPGNHDVDQTVIRNSVMLDLFHKDIEKSLTDNEIDEKISKSLRDPRSGEVLFGPLDTYNYKFAGLFQCNINPEKPIWNHDFNLNDGSILRLHGINSTLISSHIDHADPAHERLMVIGQYQVPRREIGVTYLSLCHHPPSCWKDPAQRTINLLNKRVSIQLYGHKHTQEISSTDTTLVIHSGATHPSRKEEFWQPRYNWLSIRIDVLEGRKILKIKVYPRVLAEDRSHFIADQNICGDNSYKEFSLYLESDEEEIEQSISDVSSIKKLIDEPDVKSPVGESQTPTKREIVYTFLSLSFLVREKILSDMKLLDEGDEGKNHLLLLSKIFDKLTESKKLVQFSQRINLEKKGESYE